MARGKYIVDKTYFDEINCGEKAYWLGFIWGDGYICKRKSGIDTYGYSLKISLKRSDFSHLEKIKNSLKSTHPIKFYDISGSGYNSDGESRLLISNKYMCENLYEKYGIFPNRNDITKLKSHIPKEFYPDFVRGIFDADGSISIKVDKIYGTKNASVSFMGSDSVLDFINEFLIENGISDIQYKKNVRHEGRDNGIKNIAMSGSFIIIKLMDVLYSNNNSFLERKYNKFLELKIDLIKRNKI